ncbi:MAG: DUF1189 family protein [Candidatus Roizmanbacteria bacterium]
MVFFQTILKTFTDKKFYIASATDSLGKRLKYFTVLILITSVLGSAKLSFDIWQTFGKNAQKIVNEVQYEANKFFPADLILTLDKGVLTTNQKEPLTYTPRELATYLKKENDSLKYFVVLDTQAQGEDIDNCSCAVLITSKGIHIRSNDKVEYRPFSNFASGKTKKETLDRNGYDKFLLTFLPYISVKNIHTMAIVLIALILFFTPLLSLLGWVIDLFLWSLFGYIAARIIKRPQSYGYVYKMSLYLATPFVLFDFIAWIMGIPSLAGWVTIILYMIGIAVFIPIDPTMHTNEVEGTSKV